MKANQKRKSIFSLKKKTFVTSRSNSVADKNEKKTLGKENISRTTK